MSRAPHDRRDILKLGLWSSLALPALPTPRPNGRAPRLLMLGGTRFLGPAIVKAALARNWEVTLFNRGKSNPGLFKELEQRRGDRDKNDLASLETGEWDYVVDTSGYVPAHVEATARLLGPRVKHYVFISTCSVYDEKAAKKKSFDENTPLMKVSDAVIEKTKTIRQAFRHYGAMKALCEQAAEKAMPGRVTNIRPGLIVGEGDNSDRFTYWTVRVHEGGEILAPGNPDAELQFVDVRDLGEWTVKMAEGKVAGDYNAVGYPGSLTMRELLHGMKVNLNLECSFTWAPDAWLREKKVGPWLEMPLWIPDGDRRRYDASLAYTKGLHCRSVGDTINSTLAWHLKTRGEGYKWRRVGLKRKKEAELLAAWHAEMKGGK